MEIPRSIEAIMKDMEDLFENINNLSSYEYLTKSNQLKREFERHKSRFNVNISNISNISNNNSFEQYYEDMIMF
jgi:N-glycosylase/DNA lyase